MPPRDCGNVQLQVYSRAPSPSRDYCGLTLTEREVILNIWNITFGPHVYPTRIKCILEDFQLDKSLQSEIKRLFGDHILTYITNMSNGDLNLQYLPTRIFLTILKHLACSDILNLSQTSKIFFEICNTETVWKLLFQKRTRRSPNHADTRLADDRGWKTALRLKLFTKISTGNAEKKPLNNCHELLFKSQPTNKPPINTISNDLRKKKLKNNDLPDPYYETPEKNNLNKRIQNK